MRHLSKRIEALEKIARAMRQERREIVERAILRLTRDELFSITGAYYAERDGRVPTEEQSAALQSLRSAVTQERRGALSQLAAREWELNIGDIRYATELMMYAAMAIMDARLACPRPRELAPTFTIDSFVQRHPEYAWLFSEGTDGKEVSDGTEGPAIPTGQ